MITEQDREDYPYIIGYCAHFGSYAYWTEDQIRMARECKAPRTTVRVEETQTDRFEVTDVRDLPNDSAGRLALRIKGMGLPCPEIEHLGGG